MTDTPGLRLPLSYIPGTFSCSANLYRHPNIEGAVWNMSDWRPTCLVLATTHDSENALRSKGGGGVCSEYVKSFYKSIKWWFFEGTDKNHEWVLSDSSFITAANTRENKT